MIYDMAQCSKCGRIVDRNVGWHVCQRIVIDRPKQLTEPFVSAAGFSYTAWCALRGRNHRFRLAAAAWYYYDFERFLRFVAGRSG